MPSIDTTEQKSPPLSTRLAFSFAELGPNAAEVLIRVSLLIHYTEVAGLAPGLAGLALSIGVLWDAICDPWIGRLSDGTNFRGQRRRPFFIPGALITGVSFILLFAPLEGFSQFAKFLYLTGCYCIFSSASTFLTIPLVALAGEITEVNRLRNEIFALRLIFANIGFVLATVLPAVFIAQNSIYNPNLASSIVIVLVILVGSVAIFVLTAKFDHAEKIPNVANRGILINFSLVFQNRAFVTLLASYMVANIGLTINSTLALYYYKYFLELDEISIRLVLTLFMLLFCLSIPLWAYLEKFSSYKKIIGMNIAALGVMSLVVYPLLPKQDLVGPYCCALFGGIFVGSIVLLEIQVARIVNTARGSQEASISFGTYFGFWKMGEQNCTCLRFGRYWKASGYLRFSPRCSSW